MKEIWQKLEKVVQGENNESFSRAMNETESFSEWKENNYDFNDMISYAIIYQVIGVYI